jgi:signal transduction histidine kinase
MSWPIAELDIARLMDVMPNAILAIDGVGRVIYAAGPLSSWLGWSPAELIGRSLDLTLRPRGRVPHGSGQRIKARRSLKKREGGYAEFEVEVVPAPSGLEPIAALHVLRPAVAGGSSNRRSRFEGNVGRLELFEDLCEAIIVAGEQKGTIWLNAEARELFGAEVGWNTYEELAAFAPLTEFDPSSNEGTPVELCELMQVSSAVRRKVWRFRSNAPALVYEISVTPASASRPCVAMVRDVTEHHRVEADLAEHASQLVFLLEHLPVGMLYFNRAQRCRFANGATRRLFHKSRRELVGASAEELLGGVPSLLDALNRSGRDLSSHIQTSVPWTQEGATLFLDWRFEPLDTTASGGQSPVLVLMLDVTQRTQAEQSLQRAVEDAERSSRRKTQLVSALSHDVRTPIHALSMQRQLMERLLQMKGVCDSEIESLFGEMRAVLGNVTELLNHMLELSRYDSGENADRPITFSLDEWLETSLSPHLATSSAKDIDFTWRVDVEDRVIHGDRMKLGRVLGNLVGNAVKFTVSGSVDVRVEGGDDGGLVLTVRDTGPGIPADQLDRIFDEFAQLGNPERDPNKGAGLGLAICRRLVESVGGRLTVESTLGRGTAFTARYPRTAVDASLNTGALSEPETT